MIDFEVLKAMGTTDTNLRGIFKTQPLTKEQELASERLNKDKYIEWSRRWRAKCATESRIRDRVRAGVQYSLHNYRLYATADAMMDSELITKYRLPLMLYAQGKINITACAQQLSQIETKDATGFIELGPDKKTPIGINVPKFYQFSINAGRFVVNRRLASQVNKYGGLWPYWKFEARDTGTVAQLGADCLSQAADIMADWFGHRWHEMQWKRDAFVYGHSVDFVRCAWETTKQMRRVGGGSFVDAEGQPFSMKEVIERQGVAFVNPHPSRLFWDPSAPLASINSGTGCKYVGFWDVTTYEKLNNTRGYFNLEHIEYNTGHWNIFGTTIPSMYVNQYLDTIKPPTNLSQGGTDPTADNDIQSFTGLYSQGQKDASVILSNYYEEIAPVELGNGNYPFPVWHRFVCAGDSGTVIYAEMLPSRPAAYLGLNTSDKRWANISPLLETIGFQDQLTNVQNAMLLSLQLEMVKIIAINTDALRRDDKVDQPEMVRSMFEGGAWSEGPVVIEFSGKKLREMMLAGPDGKISDIIHIHEARIGQTIEHMMKAFIQVLDTMMNMLGMSSAERGQVTSHEITAQESMHLQSTQGDIYGLLSFCIDDGRAAKKRIIAESIAAKHDGDIRVPTIRRYPEKVIQQAGFKIVEHTDEQLFEDDPQRSARRTLQFKPIKLMSYEWVYTARDGAERVNSPQSARSLVEVLQYTAAYPEVLQAMGKHKLFEILNMIFRLSGAAIDNVFEVDDVTDSRFQMSELEQVKKAIEAMTETLAQVIEGGESTQAELDATQDALGKTLPALAAALKDVAAKSARPTPKIPYDKAPPPVQRMMEAEAGYPTR